MYFVLSIDIIWFIKNTKQALDGEMMFSLLTLCNLRIRIRSRIASIRLNSRLLESSTSKTIYENLESLLTVNQVENILVMPDENQAAEFKKFLAERWQRIRGTALCYTLAPNRLINQLCIDIAKEISPLPESSEGINDLEDRAGPYFLLMPSLDKDKDVYGNNIHLLNLHEFILSDGEHTVIPIVECLRQATLSDHGVLRHMCEINNSYPILSVGEIRRLQQHSTNVNQTYQVALRFNHFRLHGPDLPAKLTRLASFLRSGGVHASGSEYNAGEASNVGIAEFYQYWDGLSKFEKDQFCELYPEIRDILGRLFRPKDAAYVEVSFCVELLANSLDTLVQRLNRDINFQTQQEVFSNALQELQRFLARVKDSYEADTKHLISIPHVLPTIYCFSLEEQQQLLKDTGRHTSLLNFILSTNYSMLTEITLRAEDKLLIQDLRLDGELATPMIVKAAKTGQLFLVKYLINNVGVDIDAFDTKGDSALSWAAYHGHYEIVEFLLTKEANINIQGYYQNTPLLNALLQKHMEVIQLLVARGARLDIRNVSQWNIFDCAIECMSDPSNIGEFEHVLMDTILLKMVLLPLDIQKECLQRHSLETVLQFTIIYRSQLLPTLLAELEAAGGYTFKMQQLMAPNEWGGYLLHMAVHNDSIEAAKALLDGGFDINAQNLSGCTALHEAILSENSSISRDLLNYLSTHPEHFLDISIRDFDDKTILDYALDRPHSEHATYISSYLKTLEPMVQKKLIYQMYWSQPHFWNNFIDEKSVDSLLELFDLTDFNGENQQLENLFENTNYQEHMNNVVKMCKKYTKSKDENVAYIAKQLLLDLFRANNKLCFDRKNITQKIQEFKHSCLDAIETAKPTLKNHWEWLNVLASFVLMILTLPVSLPLYAMGFFSLQTYTNQTINDFRQDLLQVM